MTILNNGAVLPFGLLTHNQSAQMTGFNKTYRNHALRMGIVINSYAPTDSNNLNKFTTEYDIMVFEQYEDKGNTTITYKNCVSADGLGSIADFFEKTFRVQKNITSNNGILNTKGQDGAIVLLLCLDSVSEKAIIIGAFPHPDRTTTLVDTNPHLEGEYNGVHVVINSDGSTSLTFKGATNNDGSAVTPGQGNTVVAIDTDGSYQVNHSTITQRLDKGGIASLTATGNITNATQGDFDATASGNINLNATLNCNINALEIAASATGIASLSCTEFNLNSELGMNMTGSQLQVQAQVLANIKAPTVILDGICNLGGSGGLPVLTTSTMMIGTGNLGIPVISIAYAGFALKTYAN